MSDAASAIGQRIRKIRLSRKLTLCELARRAEIDKGWLSLIENNHKEPTLAVLRRISRELRTTPAKLLA